MDKSSNNSTKNFTASKFNFKINIPESTKNKVNILKRFSLNRPSYLYKSQSQPDIFNNNEKNDNDIFFNDVRFKNCKNKFDSEFKELTSPIENILKRNKKNFLPKLSKFF